MIARALTCAILINKDSQISMGNTMAEKTMKEALDDWEKEANKLIDETKKVGATASKKFDKQLKTLQDDGAKLIDSLKEEDDEKLRKDLEKRYNVIKDKLTRAWNELKK